MVRHYQELIVWQKAIELVMEVYRFTAGFPDSEKFGLVAQLRRAAVSIPSNIAEGQGRSTTGEFKQFPGHARGSLFETATQVLIAKNLGFGDAKGVERLQSLIDEVGRLLNGLIGSLQAGN